MTYRSEAEGELPELQVVRGLTEYWFGSADQMVCC
jgi:hypothetical protein